MSAQYWAAVGVALLSFAMAGTSARADGLNSVCERALPMDTCAQDGMASASLRDLDASARKAVQSGLLVQAEVSFACLLKRDRVHEHAINLGLVRTSQHNYEGAYWAYGCAALLAPDDALSEKLKQKQLALPLTEDRRSQLDAETRPLAPETTIKPDTTAIPIVANRGESHTWLPQTTMSRVAAPISLASAIMAAAFFSLASNRADAFNDEQARSGFSDAAIDLRGESMAWQTASLVALGVAVASGVVAGLRWRD